MAQRVALFAYGLACYLVFFFTFLYAAAFVGNIELTIGGVSLVRKTIDAVPQGSTALALLINAALLIVFGLQHSIMARPAFKRWWTRWVPGPIERSTYVLFSSLALILLFWQWRPMGGVLWDVQEPAVRWFVLGLCATGWLSILVTSFLINHFDLFGLRQVYLFLRGRVYTPLRFATPGPYRWVRHPLYVGWLTAFWATPTMTLAHLVFAALTTVYILVAIRFEERDLEGALGEDYAAYRQRVPMLVPRPGRPAILTTVEVGSAR